MSVRNVFLVLHVLAAIMLIGPITVAISIFPRHALAAADDATDLVQCASRIESPVVTG